MLVTDAARRPRPSGSEPTSRSGSSGSRATGSFSASTPRARFPSPARSSRPRSPTRSSGPPRSVPGSGACCCRRADAIGWPTTPGAGPSRRPEWPRARRTCTGDHFDVESRAKHRNRPEIGQSCTSGVPNAHFRPDRWSTTSLVHAPGESARHRASASRPAPDRARRSVQGGGMAGAISLDLAT